MVKRADNHNDVPHQVAVTRSGPKFSISLNQRNFASHQDPNQPVWTSTKIRLLLAPTNVYESTQRVAKSHLMLRSRKAHTHSAACRVIGVHQHFAVARSSPQLLNNTTAPLPPGRVNFSSVRKVMSPSPVITSPSRDPGTLLDGDG